MVLVQKELKNAYIGEYGRWPGANTIAYYPFKSDLNDYTGSNPYYVARGSATYSDNMVSINTIRHSGNILSGSGDFTILAYVSFGDVNFELNFWSDTWYPRLFIRLNSIGMWDNGDWYIANLPTPLDTNTVYLCTYVRSGDNIYYYVNGELETSTAIPSGLSISGGSGYYIGGYANTDTSGKVGNLIVENRARTVQEISNYYNSTKGLYGII